MENHRMVESHGRGKLDPRRYNGGSVAFREARSGSADFLVLSLVQAQPTRSFVRGSLGPVTQVIPGKRDVI